MTETYAQRDILLSQLGFASYSTYLESDLWKSIRTAAFNLHGIDCRLCRKRTRVLHHISYCLDVLIGKELKWLIPLCNECHYKVEFDHKDRKRSLEGAKFIYYKLTNPKKKSARCNMCGNKLRKNGGRCRACNDTGVTKYQMSKKAAAYLAENK